jgi:predicted metallo-beta-lactamase superfamily hydrolase
VLGGPPTYLEGVRVGQAPIRAGIENAAKLASKVPIVIFEHHILRSEKWTEQSSSVYDAASSAEHKVMTAADYLKTPNMLLESQRERLYEEETPSPEFVKWTELHREKRRLQTPPV